MNEMIKIDFSGEQMKVSGRELHQILEVDTPYSKWFQRACTQTITDEDGNKTTVIVFHEGRDYETLVGQKCPTNNPKNPWTTVTDHSLSMDMVKEICMMSKTEKGKKIREYFIQVEKDWNSPDKLMARALKMADATIAQLTAKIEDDKPKVEFADALLVCENCIYIEELAKLLCQIGMNTGRNRLFEEMASDGFLCIRNGVKNMPTQKCVENGWLVIEKKVFERGGKTIMGYTTKVTPKGIQYFISYYKRKHGLEPVLTTSRRRVIEQRPVPRQLRAGHNQAEMR